MHWRSLLRLLHPGPDTTSLAEKALSGLGGLVGIGLIMLVSRQFLGDGALPWVVASMGASAVLLFAVPLGPLSQPWPLVGGHLLSGVIGVTVARLVPDIALAAGLAVALAIFVMYLTRSLHPPGGATALTAVAGGSQVQALGYQFLLTPVLLNLVVILAWALLINNLLPNRYYPNTLRGLRQSRERPLGHDRSDRALAITHDDLEYALKEMNEFIDVSEDDLSRLFNLSATHSRRRRMGEILCGEIMTTDVIHARYDTEVEELWQLMGRHRIRGIPVIDDERRVIGMVTIADFLNQVRHPDRGLPLRERLQRFLKRSDGLHADKPEYAGHLMSSPAITIDHRQHILELFPIFYRQGIHHLPVVDGEGRLCGIVTPKNLLVALHADLQAAGA